MEDKSSSFVNKSVFFSKKKKLLSVTKETDRILFQNILL